MRLLYGGSTIIAKVKFPADWTVLQVLAAAGLSTTMYELHLDPFDNSPLPPHSPVVKHYPKATPGMILRGFVLEYYPPLPTKSSPSTPPPSPSYTYVLECEEGMIYVGKTTNPEFRVEDHFTEGGAAWTSMYRPFAVLECRPSRDKFDEMNTTLQYMAKRGVQQVRGGPWTTIKMSASQEQTIKQMIASVDDLCYYCLVSDHILADCPFFE